MLGEVRADGDTLYGGVSQRAGSIPTAFCGLFVPWLCHHETPAPFGNFILRLPFSSLLGQTTASSVRAESTPLKSRTGVQRAQILLNYSSGGGWAKEKRKIGAHRQGEGREDTGQREPLVCLGWSVYKANKTLKTRIYHHLFHSYFPSYYKVPSEK